MVWLPTTGTAGISRMRSGRPFIGLKLDLYN